MSDVSFPPHACARGEAISFVCDRHKKLPDLKNLGYDTEFKIP